MRTDDNNFDFLYAEEVSKIPSVFRCGKKRFIAAIIIMVISLGFGLYFQYLLSNTVDLVQTPPVDGYVTGFVDFNYTYLLLTFASYLVLALTILWLVVSRLYDKQAYSKAAKLATMVFLNQRHKMLVTWKQGNGDY